MDTLTTLTTWTVGETALFMVLAPFCLVIGFIITAAFVAFLVFLVVSVAEGASKLTSRRRRPNLKA